ncbi:Positive regulator of CheA protein activity (CheW) [Chitinispirillum alkaliphilum]|nr:Positive regulator of CheA protein activity (CheW) [Chitinispirillum alkaliphilum]
MNNSTETPGDTSLLVSVFSIGQARFGIDTSRVQEVVIVKDITPVHSSPSYVIGVMNLRGRIVTVIDTGDKLDLGAIPEKPSRRIFIVRWCGEYVGLMVESVGDVVNIDKDDIQKTPGNVAGVQAELISGVCTIEKHLVALIDTDVLLAD